MNWMVESSLMPSSALVAEVEALKLQVQPNLPNLNMETQRPGWFIVRVEGRLAGLLTIFDPSGEEAEVTAYVVSDFRHRGIFSALWAEARRQWVSPGRRWLLVCDRDDLDGRAVALRKGAWDFTEFTLSIQASQRPLFLGLPGNLTLVEGRSDDLAEAEAMYSRAFGSPRDRAFLERILLDPDRKLVFLKESGRIVAGGCLLKKGSTTTIHALAVEPERQGRGWGKAMLVALLHLPAVKTWEYRIDVDSDNVRAEALYRGLGFKNLRITDYYEVGAT